MILGGVSSKLPAGAVVTIWLNELSMAYARQWSRDSAIRSRRMDLPERSDVSQGTALGITAKSTQVRLSEA